MRLVSSSRLIAILALTALFAAGEVAAKEAEISSKESYQQGYCDTFEMAQDTVDVETIFEDMEASPYKDSIREFWTTSACEAPLKNDTPVPILFNTASNPVKNEFFPKTVREYFVEDHKDLDTWLKAINTTTSDGYTFLDFLQYNIQRGYYSYEPSKDAALRVVAYLCKNGGVYSYYPLGCTQEESSRKISELIKQAKLGDLVSQKKLSRAYEDGISGVLAKDASEAVRWLTLAAEGGDKQAQLELADKSSGIFPSELPRDTAKAIQWYSRVGDKNAFYRIGYLYSNGAPDLQKSSSEAIKAWQKSFDLGEQLAALQIGDEFKGLGNFQQAMKWYQTYWQVTHRDESASANIILLYVRGGGGIDRDYAEAAAWFKKSVYSDDLHFVYSLVKQMYSVDSYDSKYRHMPPVDFQAAFSAWEELGRRGNSEAKYLADCLLRVQEVDKR